MADSKRCARCSTWQPMSEFHRQAASPDGLNSWCKACTRDYNRDWKGRPGNRARHNAWRRANEPYDRSKRARYLYGVDVATLLAAQDGRCAICGTTDPGGRWNTWHVDHDQTCCSGKRSCGKCVRGILCQNCNTGLGMFDDDPGRLYRAAMYLTEQERRDGTRSASGSIA